MWYQCLEVGRNATGQEHGHTDTSSSQLAGSVKQSDEMERVQPAEESSPDLMRERKESIDAELKGLLSPMEEEEERGKVVGGKRPSIAEMKAEM